MNKFKADRHTTKVYNLLLEAAERGDGYTRAQIESYIRKRFTNAQWNAVMRKVRERVVMELGLIIPETNKELGFKYYITDDPNHVVPGMLAKLRTQATNASKVMREREFIRYREDCIDERMNRRVIEQADILIEMNSLVEKSMQLVNENLRDAMNDRLEIEHGEVAGAAVS